MLFFDVDLFSPCFDMESPKYDEPYDYNYNKICDYIKDFNYYEIYDKKYYKKYDEKFDGLR